MSPEEPAPRPTSTLGRSVTPRLVLVVGLGGVLLAAGAARGISPEDDPLTRPAARPVTTIAPQAVSGYTLPREFTGRIEARRSADLGFQLGGELQAITVTDGQAVEAGAILARLDVRRLKARSARLAARVEQSRARLAEMRAGPRTQTVAAARARVSELAEELDLSRAKERRRESLRAEKVISQEALDEASTTVRMLIARRESAQRDLDLLLAGTRAEQLRAQEAVVSQLEADQSAVAVDLADSVLRAPFAGVVSRVLADEGTVVAVGQPVLKLVEVGELEAWVGVPPQAAAALELGSTHSVRTRSGATAARVRALLPQLEVATHTVTVVLTIEEPAQSRLLPGQVVHVEITEAVEAAGFWLPLTALDRGERDLWSVLAVVPSAQGPVVQRRDVEVLRVDTDRALVRGDLRREDRVVASGVHRLVSGERVEQVGLDAAK